MHMVSIYRSGVNDPSHGHVPFHGSIPDSDPQRLRREPQNGISSSRPRDTCSPRPYGYRACILPVYAAKCPGPKPPKGVGFTDPLSGTLNNVCGSHWAAFLYIPPEPLRFIRAVDANKTSPNR